jgi:hypothetical protein
MSAKSNPYSYFNRNSLTIVFLFLFVITLVGQALTGWKENNQEREELGGAPFHFINI